MFKWIFLGVFSATSRFVQPSMILSFGLESHKQSGEFFIAPAPTQRNNSLLLNVKMEKCWWPRLRKCHVLEEVIKNIKNNQQTAR